MKTPRNVFFSFEKSAFIALLAASFLAFMGYHHALANEAVSVALDRPAQLSAAASGGLFTAVTRAGNRLVAVGERGRILLSDDSGTTWRQVETPTSVTLTDVRFATPQEGWVVGQMGVVLFTNDGGLSWVDQFDGLKANASLLATAKADLAEQGSNDTTTANVQAARQFVSGGPSVPFLSVLPLSARSVMIAGGYGMTFTSQDAGVTWTSVFDKIPNPNGLHIYSLLRDQDSVFIIGEQGFLVRQDGIGAAAPTYTALTTPFQGSFFGSVLTQRNAVLLFGLQGTVLRSADQGKTWAQPVSGVSASIDCGLVLKNAVVVLGDVAGDLLISDDDGETYRTTHVGQPIIGLAQAPDGSVIIASLHGLQRMKLASLIGGA